MSNENDENRKQTVPQSEVLSELVRVHVKIDEIRRTFADGHLDTHQKLVALTQRVDTLETKSNASQETARRAMESASDLSKHVAAHESAIRTAFDTLATGVNRRIDSVERETQDQTKILQDISMRIAHQDTREVERERLKAEQDAERERARIEKRETDALDEAKAQKRHERRMALIGVGVTVFGICATVISSYLGTKQANHDAPPQPAQVIVVQSDAGH